MIVSAALGTTGLFPDRVRPGGDFFRGRSWHASYYRNLACNVIGERGMADVGWIPSTKSLNDLVSNLREDRRYRDRAKEANRGKVEPLRAGAP